MVLATPLVSCCATDCVNERVGTCFCKKDTNFLSPRIHRSYRNNRRTYQTNGMRSQLRMSRPYLQGQTTIMTRSRADATTPNKLLHPPNQHLRCSTQSLSANLGEHLTVIQHQKRHARFVKLRTRHEARCCNCSPANKVEFRIPRRGNREQITNHSVDSLGQQYTSTTPKQLPGAFSNSESHGHFSTSWKSRFSTLQLKEKYIGL